MAIMWDSQGQRAWCPDPGHTSRPRTDQLGMFTHKEFEQLAPVLDGFSLMTYDYSTSQQ